VPETTTGRIRRNSPPASSGDHDDFADSKFRHGSITPAAPPPTTRPWPFGDLGTADVEDVAAVADRVWPASPATALKRRHSLRHLVEHLVALPGQTWQQRWDGSPFADGAPPGDRTRHRRAGRREPGAAGPALPACDPPRPTRHARQPADRIRRPVPRGTSRPGARRVLRRSPAETAGAQHAHGRHLRRGVRADHLRHPLGRADAAGTAALRLGMPSDQRRPRHTHAVPSGPGASPRYTSSTPGRC
jgi:hypothetical protein